MMLTSVHRYMHVMMFEVLGDYGSEVIGVIRIASIGSQVSTTLA